LPAASGKISVATKSLVVPNPLMRMHLLSKDWLNARAHPEITFEIKEVSRVRKKEANASNVEVTGAFTLNGITKEITVEAEIVYVPRRGLDSSTSAPKGDSLVVRANFTIQRNDFGIRSGEFLDKVANEIALSLKFVGASTMP
jgi:polyisoprenoid-binding protein YceI